MAGNEAITRKNPLASVRLINVCNSFQMSSKAVGNTIRTLMQGELEDVTEPEQLETAIAQKLQRHFTKTGPVDVARVS